MLFAVFVYATNLFAELGPRARASGWTETCLALPGARIDFVLALWCVGVVQAAIVGALSGVGVWLGGMLAGVPIGSVHVALVPVLTLAMPAFAVRGFADVSDVRTAQIRFIPFMFGLGGLVLLAQWAEGHQAGLGGLVPFGGLCLGLVGRTAWPLAAATSLAAIPVAWRSTSAVLEGLVVRQGAGSQAAARRARGDYLPEAILLVLLAMAGSGTWTPGLLHWTSSEIQVGVGQVFFYVIPALLTPIALRLEPRALLSLRLPAARAWLAAPFVLAGALGGTALIVQFVMPLFPAGIGLRLFERGMAAFGSPLGWLVLTLGAAVSEELVFRGAVLGLLRRRFPTWLAIVMQAAAFALMHGLAIRLPHTFGIGLLFGVVAVRTRSILPTLLMHATFNLMLVSGTFGGLGGWGAGPWPWVCLAVGLVAAWASGS